MKDNSIGFILWMMNWGFLMEILVNKVVAWVDGYCRGMLSSC